MKMLKYSFIVLSVLIFWALRQPLSNATLIFLNSLNVFTWTQDQTEKKCLMEKNESLDLALARVGILEKENNSLREILDRLPANQKVAIVSSSLMSSPYGTFLIDLGANNGIALGQEVISVDSILLGKIIEVYQSIAKVELYSSYGNEIEAVLEDGTHVKLIGAGSQNYILILPKDIIVQTGSRLIAPGLEKYLIGNADDIDKNPNDPFQRILIRNPVNILTLNKVYV